MWTIPEIYIKPPEVNFNDFDWYAISFVTFTKLAQILNILKESCEDNILWIPTHEEYKRLRAYSNQVVLIDKLNYPNYGFIGLVPGCSDIKKISQEIKADNYAKILPGHVFPAEMVEVKKVFDRLNISKLQQKYKKDDMVIITSGAFFGMMAKILQIDKAKVTLLLELGDNVLQIKTFITEISRTK